MSNYKGGKLTKESPNYIGKLRSNRLASENIIYGTEIKSSAV